MTPVTILIGILETPVKIIVILVSVTEGGTENGSVSVIGLIIEILEIVIEEDRLG